MAKRLKLTDIVEDANLLEPLIKQFNELNEKMDTFRKGAKAMAKTAAEMAEQNPLEGWEDIKDFEKSIDDTTKATKKLNQTQTQQEKLQQKLNDLHTDSAQDVANLNEQIRQQRKALNDNAKELFASRDAYQELARRSNEAQKNFKTMAAQFGINSKEAQEAQKSFEEVNDQLRAIDKAAKDGRRNVGRYGESLEEATGASKKLSVATRKFGKAIKAAVVASGIGALLALLLQMKEAFAANDQGARGMAKAMAQVSIRVQVFVQRSMEAFPIMKEIVVGAFADMRLAFLEWLDGFSVGKKQITFMGETLTVFNGAQVVSNKTMKEAKEAADENTASMEDLGDAYSGMSEEIDEKVKASHEAIDQEYENIEANARSEMAISNLNRALQTHTKIMDNDAKSLAARRDAALKALQVQRQVSREEQAIAVRNLELAEKQAAAASGDIETRLRSGKAIKTNAEQFKNLAEARVALNAAQKEGAEAAADLQREAITIELDLLDQRLDILLDGTEAQVASNDRIISNEAKSLIKRRALLKKNAQLLQESFEEQVKVLNKQQEQFGETAIDFDKVLELSGKRQVEYLQSLNISERAMTRVLEVIKERTATQDELRESTEELNQAEKETAEILADVVLQQEALQKLQGESIDQEAVFAELEEERAKQAIENARERVAAAEEGSKERAEAEQELNELLLEQERKRHEEQDKLREEEDRKRDAALEKEKERQEELAQFIQDVYDAIAEIVNQAMERRVKAVENQLDRTEEQEGRLQELANQGNQQAAESLEVNRKRQAQLEAERRRAVKRQEQVELALATIKTYSANVAAGEENPFTKTVTDISVLKAFIESLPGFKEGIESLGEGDAVRVSNTGTDDYVARLDKGERVVDRSTNEELKGYSNKDLLDIVHKHEQLAAGEIQQASNMSAQPAFQTINTTIDLRETNTLLKNLTKKRTLESVNYDAISNAVVERIREGNRVSRKHYSNNGFRSRTD